MYTLLKKSSESNYHFFLTFPSEGDDIGLGLILAAGLERT